MPSCRPLVPPVHGFLGELLANGNVTPIIQRVIDLDEVAPALAEIGTGRTQAKIVVLPS